MIEGNDASFDLVEVTESLNRYRSAARTFWNEYFWLNPKLRHWDSVDRFDIIRRNLCASLVLEVLPIDWSLESLFLEPIVPLEVAVAPEWSIPILINKPREYGNGYGDDPVNAVAPGQATLLFVDYFDWDRLSPIDMRYYRVRIAEFQGQPPLVGKDALLEVQHAVARKVAR